MMYYMKCYLKFLGTYTECYPHKFLILLFLNILIESKIIEGNILYKYLKLFDFILKIFLKLFNNSSIFIILYIKKKFY